MLQELKRLSPPINPPVREQAIKLVDDWKEKMTVVVENSLEVLGLLWLLTAFELTSTYDARELRKSSCFSFSLRACTSTAPGPWHDI